MISLQLHPPADHLILSRRGVVVGGAAAIGMSLLSGVPRFTASATSPARASRDAWHASLLEELTDAHNADPASGTADIWRRALARRPPSAAVLMAASAFGEHRLLYWRQMRAALRTGKADPAPIAALERDWASCADPAIRTFLIARAHHCRETLEAAAAAGNRSLYASLAEMHVQRALISAGRIRTLLSGASRSTRDSALSRPVQPPPEMAFLVGTAPLPRSGIVSRLWDYIRRNNLQDPENKSQILTDGPLRKLCNDRARISLFELNKCIGARLRER